MSPPPLLAYPKPLQLSSSLTASAKRKSKDVPPFPSPLTPQPSQPCPRQTSSLQSSPQTFSGEVLPSHPTSLQWLLRKSYTRKGQRQDGISLHPLLPMSSPFISASTNFLKLIVLFVNCCMSQQWRYWCSSIIAIFHNTCTIRNIHPCTLFVCSKHLQLFTAYFSQKQCKGSGDVSTSSPT